MHIVNIVHSTGLLIENTGLHPVVGGILSILIFNFNQFQQNSDNLFIKLNEKYTGKTVKNSRQNLYKTPKNPYF